MRWLSALVLLMGVAADAAATEDATDADRPNVVIVFADDLGYGDLSCYGSTKIETPHLDRLAAEGRRLTSFVLPASVCTPSRAALLTGCYPKRVGLNGVLFPKDNIGLNPSELTMAELFKRAGYATACVGKWHLGHYPETLPLAHGFDSYLGIPYSNDMNHPDNSGKADALRRDAAWREMGRAAGLWRTPLVEGDELVELPVDQRTITRRYTDRAIEFVTRHAGGADAKPFFLYLPHSMPHVPLFVPEDAYDPDPTNAYTCTVEHIDAEVGRLIDTIRDLGLEEDTIVVFTSDNGPWLTFKNHGGDAGPLRSGKGSQFEGGHRVPCVVWAPGRVAAGSESGEFVSSMDLMPTFAKLLDQPLGPGSIDGLEVAGTLFGDEPSPRDELLYYRGNGKPTAIRRGDWKLVL
ncbi:MAG: sulfatase, partial [Planctomycetota bacterium]